MRWFDRLSLANKIGLLSLLVAITSLAYAALQYTKEDQNTDTASKNGTEIHTGNNSIIVNKISGDVEINLKPKD